MKEIRIQCKGAAMMPLDELRVFQGKLKKLTQRRYQKLRATIIQHGFSFPVFVWKSRGTAHIIDGHQRVKTVQEMLKEGFELRGGRLPVAWIEARSRKDAKEKVLLAASQFGQYDEQSVYEFLKTSCLDLQEFKGWGELPQISLGKLEAGYYVQGNLDERANAVPEVPKRAITKRGDLWRLGLHSLYCGDATKKRSYGGRRWSLLITDPPYGVSYSEKNAFLNAIDNGNRNQSPITNDDMTPGQMSSLWNAAFLACSQHLDPGSAYYVTGPQGGNLLLLLQSLRQAGLNLKHMLIWVKNSHVLGRCDYHYKHEPIVYGWTKGSHSFFGHTGEVSVWEIAKPQRSAEHPTMKPVELYEKAMRNSSRDGDGVVDIFAGSGTAIIAAEKLGRVAHAIELEPRYCDVIVERWQEFSGKKARRKSVA